MDMASDRLNKNLAVFEACMAAAKTIGEQLKKIPRFIKTYNRRPNNKRKRAVGYMGIGLTVGISMMQIKQILEQPIPKREDRQSYNPAIIGEGDRREIIVLPSGKIHF